MSNQNHIQGGDYVTRAGRKTKKSEKALEAAATEQAFSKFRQGLNTTHTSSETSASRHSRIVGSGRKTTGRLVDLAKPNLKSHKSGKPPSVNSNRDKFQTKPKARSLDIDLKPHSKSKSDKQERVRLKGDSVVAETQDLTDAKKARLLATQQTRRREEDLKHLDYKTLRREQQYRIELLPFLEDAENKELEAGILNPYTDADEEEPITEAGTCCEEETHQSDNTAYWVARQNELQQDGSYLGAHGRGTREVPPRSNASNAPLIPRDPIETNRTQRERIFQTIREHCDEQSRTLVPRNTLVVHSIPEGDSRHNRDYQNEAGNRTHTVNIPRVQESEPRLQVPSRHEVGRPNSTPFERQSVNFDNTNSAYAHRTWIDDIPDGEVTPSHDMAHLAFMNMTLSDTTLTPFSGDPAEWVEFTLTFKNHIHDNPCFTNSQRLGYLRKSLTGVALNKVYGLLWDGTLYGKSMRTLQSAYGNPCRVVEAQKMRLMRLPPIRSNAEIPSLCAAVGRLIQTFQLMKYDDDLRSLSLLSDLKERLPNFMLESWGGYIVRHGRRPDIMMFHQWLLDKEETLLLGSRLKTSDGSVSKTFAVSLETDEDDVAACNSARVVNNSSFQFRRPDPWCHFCRQTHWIDVCPDFLERSPSDRHSWFLNNKRCFVCCAIGHRTDVCKMKRCCQTCTRRHHTVLHDYYDERTKTQSTQAAAVVSIDRPPHEGSEAGGPTDIEATETSDVFSGATTASSGACNAFLPILPVKLFAEDGKSVCTYALIDSGSQATLLRRELADKLYLKGPRSTLTIGSVVKTEEPQISRIVHFSVSNPYDTYSEPIKIRQAWTVQTLNLPGRKLPRDNAGQVVWSNLRDLKLRDVNPSDVGLLIGVNSEVVFERCEVRESGSGPTAVRCPLGWYIMGAATDSVSTVSDSLSVNSLIVEETPGFQQLSELVQRFWSMEEFGSKYDAQVSQSVEDRRAIRLLQETIRKVEGRYEVGLLWKNDSISIPYNRPVALRRWLLLEAKLRKDETLRSEFQSIVQGYLDLEYASELTETQRKSSSTRINYIPQQAHKSAHKKLRIVNDCRQPYQGVSLNDALIGGPQLTSALIGVLIRFRCGPVAVGSDVKSMFHRVLVPMSDRDAFRFLWKRDVMQEGPPSEFQMNVHVFGAKSSPCCASFALQQTSRDNVGKFSEEALKAMIRNFYVDDYLQAFLDEAHAISVAREVKDIAASGGFHLVKWIANSPSVLRAVDHTTEAVESVNMTMDEEVCTRTLGIHWLLQKDVFSFKTELNLDDVKMTKRGLLSTISKIYDPLGFLLPFTVNLRLLLQMLWEQSLRWDQELNAEDSARWRGWLQDIAYLHEFTVARCFWNKLDQPTSFTLHTFSDSSERAYAAVAYIQTQLGSGEFNCSIVLARARVAPLKGKYTLPRLELCGAVLATRVASAVEQELDLKLNSRYFWSDSMIVVQAIQNQSKRFPVFESNRYAEIHRSTSPSQWRHVPGELNVADHATRARSVRELTPDHPWLRGPAFLWGEESGWPEQTITHRAELSDTEISSVNAASIDSDSETVGPVTVRVQCPILLERFEKLSKLLLVTALCIRYIHNLRATALHKRSDPSTVQLQKRVGLLSASEITKARLYLIRASQHEHYFDEIRAVERNGNVKSSSKISQLTPELMDGLLRMRGRLDNATVSMEAKHPCILHPKHRFSWLLACHAHRNLHHFGPEYVIAEIRKLYWIVNIRSLVKQVIFHCLLCHRRRVEPCVPIMAQLPAGRLGGEFPFANTGLDFLGQFYIKQGRKREKRWVALFTCMATRALHLELVNSLSTDAFIMALRRFFARRGVVHEIHCDNGTNFVGCDRELQEAVKRWNSDERLKSYYALREVNFHFIPPSSPHMGGVWERIVKCVKRGLNACLKGHVLHEDTLHTVLCEVEATVNSRPLTVNSDDPNDPVALTPNHFLLNRFSPVSSADVVFDSDNVSRKRWRQSQFHAQMFWKRFRSEYLPGLNITRKWKTHNPNLSVNDVVMIASADTPRGYWPLARIIRVIPSAADGCIRKCELRTRSGTCVRPVSKLCLLEGSQSLR